MISKEITLTINFNIAQRSKAKGVRVTTFVIYCKVGRMITKCKASETIQFNIGQINTLKVH